MGGCIPWNKPLTADDLAQRIPRPPLGSVRNPCRKMPSFFPQFDSIRVSPSTTATRVAESGGNSKSESKFSINLTKKGSVKEKKISRCGSKGSVKEKKSQDVVLRKLLPRHLHLKSWLRQLTISGMIVSWVKVDLVEFIKAGWKASNRLVFNMIVLPIHCPKFIGKEIDSWTYRADLSVILIDPPLKTVAIKQLDLNGVQGNREFLVEVMIFGLLHHPNLVNLIGYCVDGDLRLLVYEYMPLGSLEGQLHGDLSSDKRQLDWHHRMKIAAGQRKD
ncbi:hypothetical protein ZIOFF_054455 [Zingiber officinale]|uniref:Protein kinase domain-containing protein n=1 Tax=Zingiber officinale TaxID=94328 RepID=A0A8J5FHR0_ZINOF|nr:hypothetical protein ZIOFF_054455 [Zingiber officinale]